jgi:parallel beta-helix repeat protein
MNKDLGTSLSSGNAIEIRTNNIVLDCNGFKLSGLGAGLATEANGIYAATRFAITIRDCNVRGFASGIHLASFDSGAWNSGGSHLVENNRLDGNTQYGIFVAGAGSVIRGNIVNDTGGSTVRFSPVGILAQYAMAVDDNYVESVIAEGDGDYHAAGIQLTGESYVRVSGNRISGVIKTGSANPYGIRVSASGKAVIADNQIFLTLFNVNSRGIACSQPSQVVRDNTVIGFSYPNYNCTDAGGNYFP